MPDRLTEALREQFHRRQLMGGEGLKMRSTQFLRQCCNHLLGGHAARLMFRRNRVGVVGPTRKRKVLHGGEITAMQYGGLTLQERGSPVSGLRPQ